LWIEIVKTLLLGLGNPVLTDDSVGLKVVEQLRPLLVGRPDLEIDEDYWGGLRLMEHLVGYDRAILVDAICTGAAPGTIHRLAVDSIPTQHSASAHDANLATALALGRQAGAHLPANNDILLVGIEADDIITFSEQCSPQVQAAIPQAVQTVMAALEMPGGRP
jgi:hydrogenase maturation protease